MDLLFNAALAWQELLQYRYDIICGKSKKLYHIALDFQADEFYHLAGFPHAKDIVFPVQFSQTKMLDKVLDRTITGEMLSKSENYEKTIKSKLSAICALKELLDNNPSAYLYRRDKLPFYSAVDAKYLLVNREQDIVFLFTDTSNDGKHHFSKSTFTMGDHDFRANQSPATVLRIERTDLTSGCTVLLYHNPRFVQQ